MFGRNKRKLVTMKLDEAYTYSTPEKIINDGKKCMYYRVEVYSLRIVVDLGKFGKAVLQSICGATTGKTESALRVSPEQHKVMTQAGIVFEKGSKRMYDGKVVALVNKAIIASICEKM